MSDSAESILTEEIAHLDEEQSAIPKRIRGELADILEIADPASFNSVRAEIQKKYDAAETRLKLISDKKLILTLLLGLSKKLPDGVPLSFLDLHGAEAVDEILAQFAVRT